MYITGKIQNNSCSWKYKTRNFYKWWNSLKFLIICIYLEEPIGYPAHTRLISPSVCPLVHPSGIQKTYILNVGIEIKKSHLSVVPSLRIPIPTLLYCKFVSHIKTYFLLQAKNWHTSTSHVHCRVYPLHVGWRNFLPAVLERFLQPMCSRCLRSKSEEVAGLYNGVTIIIETNNLRLR